MQPFKNRINSKIKTNRKLIRQIDHTIVGYSLLATAGQMLIFMVLGLTGGMYTDYTRVIATAGVILIMFAAIQVLYFLKFDHIYGRGPSRCRKVFALIYTLYTVAWSGFVAFGVSIYQLSPNSMILVTFMLGSVVMISLYWAPYLAMNRCIILISLLPMCIVLLSVPVVQAAILGFLTLGFTAVLLHQAQLTHSQYWVRIDTVHQLEEKTRDLEHAVSEAKTASTVKVDFLANLTHEIRTPMNNILGMISLISDEKLDKNQQDMLSVARCSGESLLALIDDILDFSKIATGSIVLDSNVFNLRNCIEEVVVPLAPLAHEKRIEINVVFDPDMPLRARGDPVRIAQITHNLIMNAIKFSDDGEIVVAVHLTRLSNLQGLLRIHISDEGIGLSMDEQAKLFDAFYRSEESGSRRSSGTGLGLAICKGLVERMEGQIGLISELGKGSTFWFTVPIRLSTQQKQSVTTRQKFSDSKVLLVNAPSGMNQGLSNDLKAWNIHVETISGMDQALQVLRTSSREACGFDLVIINFTMHYAGTLKLAKIIAEDPVLSGTKQMILTTLEQSGSEKVIGHTASMKQLIYINKPITRAGLFDGLTRLFDDNSGGRILGINPVNAPVGDDQGFACVLVVEDNKVNQMVAKGILKRLGYVVKTVNNGREALGQLESRSYDLILMDCQMPIMDGYEATERIREYERNKHKPRTPIIAMTAYAMEGQITRCLAVGMDDYVAKPVNMDLLEGKLKQWLHQAKESTDRRKGVIYIEDNNKEYKDSKEAKENTETKDNKETKDNSQGPNSSSASS